MNALHLLLPGCLLLAALATISRADTPPVPAIPIVQERGGLPHVFAKLSAGKPVTIVWFGGSITAGAGASDGEKTSYRALVGNWFQTAFPKSAVTNVNAAIGGTGSDLGAFRAQRDVLSHHPDLVFVEFAVNDGSTPEAMIDRSMEGIVRQIRRSDPRTDICFVYTFVEGQLPEFAAGRLTRAVQRDEVVAAHYGIPSVNMAVPAARQLLDGRLTKEAFSKDGVHPKDVGYQIYADALVGFLETQRGQKKAAEPWLIPAPLRPDSLEHARMIGPADVGTLSAGWALDTSNPTHDFPQLLASQTPGAEQTVAFAGPILAMFYVLGPDTGAFDFRIDDRAWQTMDPFDVFAKGYARSHYRLLADGLTNGPHRVTFKIRPTHNPDSKGDWTRIGFLLANPPK